MLKLRPTMHAWVYVSLTFIGIGTIRPQIHSIWPQPVNPAKYVDSPACLGSDPGTQSSFADKVSSKGEYAQRSCCALGKTCLGREQALATATGNDEQITWKCVMVLAGNDEVIQGSWAASMAASLQYQISTRKTCARRRYSLCMMYLPLSDISPGVIAQQHSSKQPSIPRGPPLSTVF